MKIGIVGTGNVGCACAMAAAVRGSAREIVLVNRTRKTAEAVATDIRYGVPLGRKVDIYDGDYGDLEGAEVVLITSGVNEKTGGATDRNDPAGRLRLLDANVEVYKDIIPRLDPVAREAIVLVVTDPPDPLADAARMLGHDRVLSTGTYLDSLRFKFHLARRLGVSPASVDAQILGEHGTSEVFVWSSAGIGGTPITELLAKAAQNREELCREIEREVRFANIAIIEGIGASQHGIGMVCARIAEIVLRDERGVIPIGSFNSRYGVTLSLPSVLGRQGVAQVFEPEMSEDERHALRRSAEALRAATARIKI